MWVLGSLLRCVLLCMYVCTGVPLEVCVTVYVCRYWGFPLRCVLLCMNVGTRATLEVCVTVYVCRYWGPH